MFYSTKEASKMLGLSYEALRRMAKNGDVPAFMVGCKYMFNIDLVAEALKEKSLQNTKE